MALLNTKQCIPFEQFQETTMPQEFSLPMPIMKYIWSNPTSPEVYQTLIKICKLFFLKNPILVLKNLSHTCMHTYVEWKYYNANECDCIKCKHKYKIIDVNNLHGKIWLLESFDVSSHTNEKLVSGIIPQIYQCDIRVLHLLKQHLSYNELKFFSSDVKECFLYSCVITYDDSGDYVSLEDIIKCFSGAEVFYMDFYKNSVNAYFKSYDEFIVACNTVKKVELDAVPVDFDVQKFYQRLKSSKNRALINIHSPGPADHRLNQVIDEILLTEFFEFVPSVISYWGISSGNFIKMSEIQEKEAAKYR